MCEIHENCRRILFMKVGRGMRKVRVAVCQESESKLSG